MTECEWIESQYEEYGETYINDLMDKGFVPVKTHRGYRWVFEGEVNISGVSGIQRALQATRG